MSGETTINSLVTTGVLLLLVWIFLSGGLATGLSFSNIPVLGWITILATALFILFKFVK